MFKVVPFWEFCMLVNSMFLLKFCQISVLRSLVFLTVCSSLILLGFSFCCSKNPTFGHKRFNSSSKIFAWGKCVFFGFCTKIQYFQYLCKFSIFMQIFNICINLSIFLYNIVRTFVFLSLVCVQAKIFILVLQESERGIIVFLVLYTKNSTFVVYLFSSLWSVYKQIYLASGVRERESCHFC